jgi:hypothetical protein
MKQLGNLLTLLLILGIIIALGYASLLGIKFIIAQFNLLETELTGIMIIAASVLLVCTLILASAIRYSRPKGDIRVHQEKAYIYTDFISYYSTIRESIRNEGKIYYRFRNDMVLWAGKNVLKSYSLFNKYITELNPDNPKILEQAEKVIFEMRKEIGYDSYGLKNGYLDNLIFHSVQQMTENEQTRKIKTS